MRYLPVALVAIMVIGGCGADSATTGPTQTVTVEVQADNTGACNRDSHKSKHKKKDKKCDDC